MDNTKTAGAKLTKAVRFEVGAAPESDIGRLRVRIHFKRRAGVGRHGIVTLTTASGRTVLASILGHELDQNAILMDYDMRSALGVTRGQSVDLIMEPAGPTGIIKWYFSNPDPAIRAPALIAGWSLILGLAGIVLGIGGLVVSAIPLWR